MRFLINKWALLAALLPTLSHAEDFSGYFKDDSRNFALIKKQDVQNGAVSSQERYFGIVGHLNKKGNVEQSAAFLIDVVDDHAGFNRLVRSGDGKLSKESILQPGWIATIQHNGKDSDLVLTSRAGFPCPNLRLAKRKWWAKTWFSTAPLNQNYKNFKVLGEKVTAVVDQPNQEFKMEKETLKYTEVIPGSGFMTMKSLDVDWSQADGHAYQAQPKFMAAVFEQSGVLGPYTQILVLNPSDGSSCFAASALYEGN